MTAVNRAQHGRAWLGRWITRGLGVLVDGFFGLIVVLALTNEDPPAPQAWPMLACLIVCMVSVLVAWRWEQIGGVMVLFGSVALAATVLYSSLVTGLGPYSLVAAFIYPVPFFVVGGLTLADARADTGRAP
jgi:FtsH-binding integral membrane protein